MVALLRAAWVGLRRCHVENELARSINPLRGLPPGCPTSGATLAAVLPPWNGQMGSSAWAYMDDRSIKVTADADLDAALTATAQFDDAVGLLENEGKRQFWSDSATVEHLGLRLQGNQEAP